MFEFRIYSFCENSDVHSGFASVNSTILRLTNPDINFKRWHQLYNLTNM